MDDLLIGYKDEGHMLHIKATLEQWFKMVNAGPASWVLGMQVCMNTHLGAISIDQSQYIHKVLQRFGMSDCKPVPTPLPEKMILRTTTDEEVDAAQDYPYLQVIGSIMYAMLGMRLDITYAVSTLSQYSSHPGTQHVNAIKHLLHYLKGSANYGIIYSCDGGGLIGHESKVHSDTVHNGLVGYTDSDFAMDLDSHQSISGAVFLLTGGSISWSSKL